VKGCARTFLLQCIGFLAAAGAVMVFLRAVYGHPPSKTLGVSLLTALFACIALGLLFGIAKPVRERAALRRCLAGKRPSEGERAGIAGTIEPAASGETLRAPFSGVDSLAYRYEIYEMRRIGKSSSKVTYFEGVALVPSVVTSAAGRFPLLAVPTFDFGAEEVEPGKALFHWTEHAKAAPFEPDPKKRTLEKEWTDDDGRYRCEKRWPMPADAPIEACRFRETLVRPGEKVYVVGRYSEAKGGIVPDPNWARDTRLMKGDGDAVFRQLGRRIATWAVVGVLSGAAAAGILLAFVSHAR
jgi:hypothetical protein